MLPSSSSSPPSSLLPTQQHHHHPPEILFPPTTTTTTKRFQEVAKCGEGAFGDVFVGVDHLTGHLVAIKNVRLSSSDSRHADRSSSSSLPLLPKAALRELRALQQLEEHENVLRLLDAFPSGASLALVLEYMPSDLDVVLRERTSPLPASHIKCYMWMLLQGVHFLHARGILHRDLKPSNLLLSANGVLKIGDLGQARVHTEPPLESYSHQVGTKWYRSPELLFGARKYGPAVDLWACGCILGEVACLFPLFPGHNDVDQLFRVLQVLGTPTETSWPTATTELPDYHKVAFPEMAPQDLAMAFPRVPRQGVGLLKGLLKLDPAQRLTAEEALKDDFFFLRPLACDPLELRIKARALPKQLLSVASSQGGGGQAEGMEAKEEEMWG